MKKVRSIAFIFRDKDEIKAICDQWLVIKNWTLGLSFYVPGRLCCIESSGASRMKTSGPVPGSVRRRGQLTCRYGAETLFALHPAQI